MINTPAAEARLQEWASRTDPITTTTPQPAEILPRLTSVGDEVLPHLIARVLSALPPPVAAYVLDRVTFVCVGLTMLGFCGPMPPFRPWTIALSAFGEDTDRFSRLVAHEVAHAWLLEEPEPGTQCMNAFKQSVIVNTPLCEVPIAARDIVERHRRADARDERDAERLATAWGFGPV